jgi:hypothetical protein
VLVSARLWHDLLAPGGLGAPVPQGAEHSQSVDACPLARVPGGAAAARSLTALAQQRGGAEAEAAAVVASLEAEAAPLAAAPTGVPASPPFAQDGTKWRLVRPQDPPEQPEG